MNLNLDLLFFLRLCL